MAALKVGDPLEEDTEVGPLASEQGRADLEELVDDARRSGAAVLCGGERPDGPGWYYPPTVLAGVTREMRIHREEAFGPVATLYRATDLDEAVAHRQRLAVRSEFQRVDARRGRGRPFRPGSGGRRGVRQRDDGVPSGLPVRRGEAVRVRP